MELAGKVALITGAANGIGRTTAEHLATCGAKVVVADIDGEGAARVAHGIEAAGGEAFAQSVDIAAPKGVAALIGATRARFGRLDILHNNAAATDRDTIGRDTDVVGIDLEVWDRAFAINLRGTMLMCKCAIPLMLEGGGGSIINMSSNEGILPRAGVRVAYATTKAAIGMLTRHIAASFGRAGLRCNAIAPGTTLTDTLKAHIPPEMLRGSLARVLTPALGEPIDVAHLVAYLSSDQSRYLTGQILSIDGGVLAFQPA